MKEVNPSREVTILTSYERVFMLDCWDVVEKDGEFKGTSDEVSKITFTDDGVVLRYNSVTQYIPNHQMVSMTW